MANNHCVFATIFAMTFACGQTRATHNDASLDANNDAASDVSESGDAPLGPPYLRALESLAALQELASGAAGVKWLGKANERDATPPVGDGCLLQNPIRWAYHLPFLQTFPQTQALSYNEYVARVLRRDTRTWWGGDIGWRENLVHPLRGTPGVLLFTFYTEDDGSNRLRVDDIREVTALIRRCAPFAADRIAFSPYSNEQLLTTEAAQEQLASEGIAVILP